MQQDPSARSALLPVLVARLRGPAGTGEDLKAITAACEEARAAGLGDDPALVEALDAATAGLDPILRESAVALVTGDLGRYVRILDMVGNVMDLAPLEGINQIFWSMQRQIFLMRMTPATVPDFTPARLFPFYERFVGEVARRHGLRPAARAAGAPATGRVVMVTNQLLSSQHQPTRDLLRQASLLQGECGREVVILNTNMMPDRYYSPFVPPFAAAVEEQLTGEQLIGFEGRTFRLLSSIEPGLTAAKLQGFLSAVEAVDPDVVVALGGSVLVADLLAPARPLVSVATTTGATLSLADIVLDYGGTVPPATEGRLAKSWRPFRLGLSLRRDGIAASRAGFGIADDAFACIVVSNRLDSEVSPDFLALLERLLDAVPRAELLFAGVAESLPGRLARSRHAARLRWLGYVERMDALMGVCDLYLNPRRTGGGASAAQALAAGIPALSLPGGDVASVVGPAFLPEDAEALLQRAVALAGDAALMAGARAAAAARFAELAAEGGDASRLAAYLDEAIALFDARR
ncbi:glycosyltransferase [Azospirillum thermophilum]|uniref:Glycosyltransferase n=1 Tax=Azospirillum thermophilum TaxID=2202148 RepID=A0A2S2CZF1_9PROT|nr:glycosyltransferase [Azospirillum thermophilum]AWK89760.1 hypothetical protein DEW08_27710 [Azospirillum thermophilum]